MIVFIYEIDNETFGILYDHNVLIKSMERGELFEYQDLEWYSFSNISNFITKKVSYTGEILFIKAETMFEGINQIIFKAMKTIFK